jgi:hypothetical protein
MNAETVADQGLVEETNATLVLVDPQNRER